MEVKIYLGRWDEYHRLLHVEVSIPNIGQNEYCRVSQSSQFGEPGPVRIGWSSYGAVDPIFALAASKALEAANLLAVRMERIQDWRKVAPPKGKRWGWASINGRGPEVKQLCNNGITITQKAWVDEDQDG